MSPSGRKRRTTAGPRLACAAALGLVTGAGASVAANLPAGAATTTAAPPSTIFPGITVSSDGWIRYTSRTELSAAAATSPAGIEANQAPTTSSLNDSLASYLVDPTIETLVGSVNQKGQCAISQGTSNAPGQGPSFSEEIAYNPITCQAQYKVGHLQLPGSSTVGAGLTSPGSAASPTSNSIGTGEQSAPLAMTAASTTTQKNAYLKSAYLDPLDITINSLASNLTWDINNPVSCASFPTGHEVAYEFAYDGWSSTGPQKAIWKSLTKCTTVHLEGTDDFVNSDFEAVIVDLFGPEGYALCGFTSSPATFTYEHEVTGTNTGSFSTWSNDTKSGGCTDLVHRDAESTYGSTT